MPAEPTPRGEPRTGALRPEEESDLDRVARSADVGADVEEDEAEVPRDGGAGPAAGEGTPGRVTAPHDGDPRTDTSHPTLRGDTADREAGRG